MQSNSARVLRGLSIAIMVLSIIALVLVVLFGLVLGGLGAVAANPEVQSNVSMSIEGDAETMQALEDMGMSSADAPALLGVFLGLGILGMVVVAVLCIVSLIAGIVGKGVAANPSKAGAAMVWMIVSAVISFLYGDIVIMVLSIIAAVYAHKVKKELAAASYGAPYQQ